MCQDLIVVSFIYFAVTLLYEARTGVFPWPKGFILTDIRDFTTLFCVNLRRGSSEWLEPSTESVLACHDFSFFEHAF